MSVQLPIQPNFSKHREIRKFLLQPNKVGHVLQMNAYSFKREEIIKHYLPNSCYTNLNVFLHPKPKGEPYNKWNYSWIFSTRVPLVYPNNVNHTIENAKAIQALKECSYAKEFAIVDITLKTAKKEKYPGFDAYPYNDRKANHAVTVILDMRGTTIKGYYIDSATTGVSVRKKQVEDSLEIDISNFLGMKVKMVSYDEEACPVFDVQSRDPWCATWSLFMFISHILNKSRKKVYTYLKNIQEDCRYRIIGLFLFEIWEITGKPTGEHGIYYNKKLYDVWNFE